MPSSIDLLPTHTLISSFFKPPNLAIFNSDLKGSLVLVQSVYYRLPKKLKIFHHFEHLAITEAFSAYLSRGNLRK